MTSIRRRSFYEFFSGGGMARAGLGEGWKCLFANDFDPKKVKSYKNNWGEGEIWGGDIRECAVSQIPGQADLAWASFPCQDLSLAGPGAGLGGGRSGTFWPFWRLMSQLKQEARSPALIVLENVCGTLTSHSGKDFAAICGALHEEGYRFGALVVDAVHFVPQSRPRLFIIAVQESISIPEELVSSEPAKVFHTRTLSQAKEALPKSLAENWIWWALPQPPERAKGLADIIETSPSSVDWHTPAETKRLLSMMSAVNLEKVRAAKRASSLTVGCVYKRTRRDEAGNKVQRAEVRFDDVAGCLRTPAGGSSRQLIMVVEGRKVRSRLISARETARLMGLDEGYALPENYNEAYHLTGDGVVVPVVRFLAHHIFEPLLSELQKARFAA